MSNENSGPSGTGLFKKWNRLDETGQMSIFVALIFQVLFVFFAMVVNVGLLVHDKINLQNAVDLGAYYAAQKQAEILNEIAHINFQMRQDYKLLSWRYRVMGTLGREGEDSPNPVPENMLPPARKNSPGSLSDKEWVHPGYGPEDPAVCVSNYMWSDILKDSNQDENNCKAKYTTKIPKIPDLPQVAPFVPGVSTSAAFTQAAQKAQEDALKYAGPLNWAYTMELLYSYKLAIGARKVLIRELRRNLIDPDFKDRNIESVKDGVVATFLRNLTYANRLNFQPSDLQMINGLANPNCSRGDEGEFVLPENRTVVALIYIHYDESDGWTLAPYGHQDTSGLDTSVISQFDPGGVLMGLSKGEPDPTHPMHSSLGFEKNPWCMAYVGVKATTKVSKPFAPMGAPIELTARAFAQPFGGRIGPWYRERWSRGAPNSTEGDRTDPLTSPRLNPGGSLDDTNKTARLPNYSRYPGDRLGLKSELSMGAQSFLIRPYSSKPKDQRLQFRYYSNFNDIPAHGDPLANDNGGIDIPVRKAELGAVAPDLFDATYYSVDPNYPNAYINSGPDRFSNVPQVNGKQVKQGPDIGGRLDNDNLKAFDVEKQIVNAMNGALDPQVVGKLFYVIKQWEHLLTGWVQASAQDFKTFPGERFGRCQTAAADNVPVPGKCWMGGGRTGYSVRLISRSHLQGANWHIGGDGEPEGGILNPPAPDF